MDEESREYPFWSVGTVRIEVAAIGLLTQQSESVFHPHELGSFPGGRDGLLSYNAARLVDQICSGLQDTPDRVRAYVKHWNGEAWDERTRLFEVLERPELRSSVSAWVVAADRSLLEAAPHLCAQYKKAGLPVE